MGEPRNLPRYPFCGQDDLVLSESNFKGIMNKKKICHLTGKKVNFLPTPVYFNRNTTQ